MTIGTKAMIMILDMGASPDPAANTIPAQMIESTNHKR